MSEDEEEYGEFQKQRLDGVDDSNFDIWSDTYEDLALDPDIHPARSEESTMSSFDEKETRTEQIEHSNAYCDFTLPGRTKLDQHYDARKARAKQSTSKVLRDTN